MIKIKSRHLSCIIIFFQNQYDNECDFFIKFLWIVFNWSNCPSPTTQLVWETNHSKRIYTAQSINETSKLTLSGEYNWEDGKKSSEATEPTEEVGQTTEGTWEAGWAAKAIEVDLSKKQIMLLSEDHRQKKKEQNRRLKLGRMIN